MRILLVEDEQETRQVLQTALVRQNFLVDQAADAETAWELLQQFNYDLIVLDIILPNLDGFSLCRRLRESNNPVLILVLTIRDRLSDKLLGFESGADDYLTKPYALPELMARIHSLTRRHTTNASPVLTYGLLRLDPISRQISYAGQPLSIRRKEYLLLELLMRNPERVFSRPELIERLWSLEQELPTEATVKSHIRSIRRKLEQVGAIDLIETLYGQGYRLNPAFLKLSAPSAAALEQVQEATTQVWQRAYIKSLQRIEQLEQALLDLQAGRLEPAGQDQAVFTAHQLAGALSVFGFDRAAELLLQIEDSLRKTDGTAELATQLLQLVPLVRAELIE